MVPDKPLQKVTLTKKTKQNLLYTGIVLVALIGFGVFAKVGLGVNLSNDPPAMTTAQPSGQTEEAERLISPIKQILLQCYTEVENVDKALVALNELSKYPHGRFKNMRFDDAESERLQLQRIIDIGLASQKKLPVLLSDLEKVMLTSPPMSKELEEGITVFVRGKDDPLEFKKDIQVALLYLQTLLELVSKEERPTAQ